MLATRIRDDARQRFAARFKEAAQVVGAGTLLDPNALTLGFARRFATYKRANLIFRDIERLRQLLVDVRRPVQIIFAGKAHPPTTRARKCSRASTSSPATPSSRVGSRSSRTTTCTSPTSWCRGWTCGSTSPGAARGLGDERDEGRLNGVPQLGTLDGWWQEGYDGLSGWAIPGRRYRGRRCRRRRAVYRLLEDHVIPSTTTATLAGVPIGWVDKMRHALGSPARFTARRMVQNYVQEYYAPAIRARRRATIRPPAEAHDMAELMSAGAGSASPSSM